MKYDVDFLIFQIGSFTKIEAISQAAREAPGRLLADLEEWSPAGLNPAWRAFPEAVAPYLDALVGAGYRLEYQ